MFVDEDAAGWSERAVFKGEDRRSVGKNGAFLEKLSYIVLLVTTNKEGLHSCCKVYATSITSVEAAQLHYHY